MSLTKIQSVSNRVRYILDNFEFTRNSDTQLYEQYVIRFHYNLVADTSALEFLNLMAEGKIPSLASISRARRKLQQEYPELRGSNYNARHREATRVRNAVRENTLI